MAEFEEKGLKNEDINFLKIQLLSISNWNCTKKKGVLKKEKSDRRNF